jgi:hypothetical protein
VLTTDHCYPAVLAQLRRAPSHAGARLRIAPVPLPATDPALVARAVVSHLRPDPAAGRRSRRVVQRAGVPGSRDRGRLPARRGAGAGRRRARGWHAAGEPRPAGRGLLGGRPAQVGMRTEGIGGLVRCAAVAGDAPPPWWPPTGSSNRPGLRSSGPAPATRQPCSPSRPHSAF